MVRVCEIALLDLVTQLLGHLSRYPRVRDLVDGNLPVLQLRALRALRGEIELFL